MADAAAPGRDADVVRAERHRLDLTDDQRIVDLLENHSAHSNSS